MSFKKFYFLRCEAESSIDKQLNWRSVLEVVNVEVDSLVGLLVSGDFHAEI